MSQTFPFLSTKCSNSWHNFKNKYTIIGKKQNKIILWITTNKKDSKMSYSQSYPHYPQYVDKKQVNKKDNIKQKIKKYFKVIKYQ